MTVSLYVTTGDEDEAERLARLAMENELAACANIWPITSVYRWEGKICQDAEHALLLKTRKELTEPLMKLVEEHHSYDCPCMVALEWKEAYGPYALWVEAETGKQG